MSRARLPAIVLGAVAALGLLAGCDNATGTPQPTGSSPSSDDASAQAPKVQHPLDATAFVKNPCSALTASDLASFGLTGATTDSVIPGAAGV